MDIEIADIETACIESAARIDRAEPALAALLATRICHDLAGLCGTLQGALELLGEAAEPDPEAMQLSQEAASALCRRLRLIRAAWGCATGPLDRAGLLDLCAGLAGGRLAVDAAGLAADATFAAEAGRVVLNALLLAAEALPLGGTIAIAGDGADVSIAIAGPRAAWPADLASLFAAAAPPPVPDGPRHLQAPLLAVLAGQAGAALALVEADGAPARLRLTLPIAA